MHQLRRTPPEVRITRRHHPLVGQTFEVLREDQGRLSIRLADGTSMRVPREWTDADGDGLGTAETTETVFTVGSLHELIGLVAALRDRP